MKKIYALLIIAAIIFSLNTKSFAQPKFILSAHGGYSLPMGDFKNDIVLLDTVPENWPYLMKNGYNFGAEGKLAVNRMGNIRVVLGINYNSFTNTGNIQSGIPSDGAGGTVPTIEFNPKVNILGISLGGEYGFMPKQKANPFLGLDITGNFYSGTFNDPAGVKTKLKSETRIGLQFGGGVDYMFSRNVGGLLGVKYNLANLLGKGADDESEIATNEVDLGDKEHTGQVARNIGYLQLYAGLSFYFGRPTTTRPYTK